MASLLLSTVFLRVLYWRPDHPLLLQTFEHQFEDIVPSIPRTHGFLKYWQSHIVATIKSAEVDVGDGQLRPVRTRHVSFEGRLH